MLWGHYNVSAMTSSPGPITHNILGKQIAGSLPGLQKSKKVFRNEAGSTGLIVFSPVTQPHITYSNNVKGWRSADNSIPSRPATEVDYLVDVQVIFFGDSVLSAGTKAKTRNQKLTNVFRPHFCQATM